MFPKSSHIWNKWFPEGGVVWKGWGIFKEWSLTKDRPLDSQCSLTSWAMRPAGLPFVATKPSLLAAEYCQPSRNNSFHWNPEYNLSCLFHLLFSECLATATWSVMKTFLDTFVTQPASWDSTLQDSKVQKHPDFCRLSTMQLMNKKRVTFQTVKDTTLKACISGSRSPVGIKVEFNLQKKSSVISN